MTRFVCLQPRHGLQNTPKLTATDGIRLDACYNYLGHVPHYVVVVLLPRGNDQRDVISKQADPWD